MQQKIGLQFTHSSINTHQQVYFILNLNTRQKDSQDKLISK